MSVRDSVKAYLEAGLDVIPYARGEKAPRDVDWTTKRYTLDDFSEETNVGLRLSEMVDIDCDVPEAGKAAARFLPPAPLVHGRPSKPRSHYFFKPDQRLTTLQFRDTDNTMMVELRAWAKSGTPSQTMIPPSVHPSGEPLRWDIEERNFDTVPAEALVGAVRAIAVVALCVRHWPSRGARHEARLALAGYLLRAGGRETSVAKILDTITDLTGGNERDAEACVRDTAAKLANGEGQTTGGPKLAELLGADTLKVLNRITGNEERAAIDEVVAEMNARHFVIRVGRDELVGQDDGESVVFQSPASVAFRYENQRVRVGEAKGKPIYKTKFEIWREHPDRREHRTLTFAPPPLVAHERDYNLWKGFAVEPDPSASCARMLAHIREVVCAGNDEHAEYLLDLLAFGVQNPGLQSEIATVLRGLQGTGKGLFVRTYGELFGKHYVHLTKKEQLTGKFNDQLSRRCVVFADEAFFAGDPTISGPLKAVITEPEIQIERKGVDQYTEKNCIKLFMATNSEWAVPAEFRERRMFVLDVSDRRIQDHDYFEALREEIAAGGKPALLHYLLQRPVDRKRLRKAPVTAALQSQQDLSLKPEVRWWKECLMKGMIGGLPWPAWIAFSDLWRAYLAWCEDMKVMRRASEFDLSRRLTDITGGKPARGYTLQRDETGRPTTVKVRARGWNLPSLETARKLFDAERGSRSSWVEADLPEVQPGEELPY